MRDSPSLNQMQDSNPSDIRATSTGKNTVASFRAIVSCLQADGSITNEMTDAFPATQGLASEGGGNAKIEANLALPPSCLAPIVFVTSPGGAWFAVTGY